MPNLSFQGDFTSLPSANYKEITPSDVTDLQWLTRSIIVGGAGTLAAVRNDDTVVSFTVVAGQTLSICAKRVNATGTTATGLVALY